MGNDSPEPEMESLSWIFSWGNGRIGSSVPVLICGGKAGDGRFGSILDKSDNDAASLIDTELLISSFS